MSTQSYKYNTKKPESTSMSGVKSENPALSLKVKFQQNLYMHPTVKESANTDSNSVKCFLILKIYKNKVKRY